MELHSLTSNTTEFLYYLLVFESGRGVHTGIDAMESVSIGIC